MAEVGGLFVLGQRWHCSKAEYSCRMAAGVHMMGKVEKCHYVSMLCAMSLQVTKSCALLKVLMQKPAFSHHHNADGQIRLD